MKNKPWIKGTLLRRYKRFLADIRLEDGTIVTAFCPNTGSMKSCSSPESPVLLSEHDNPKRKHRYTWERIFINNTWVGINTAVPNKLVYDSLIHDRVPELTGYTHIAGEVPYGRNSRIDLLLSTAEQVCYVEIKNVTLVENSIARFPDAVTSRGTKHLIELYEMVQSGHRAVMFYLVQRGDALRFEPAADIDPAYAATLKRVHDGGVEILVYRARVSEDTVDLDRSLPYRLEENR